MKNKIKIGIVSILVMACAMLFSGCGKGPTKEYGKAETMMMLSTEKHRYEEVYTDEIWSSPVDDQGTTLDAALTVQIHDFLKEVRLMSLMAEENKVTLTPEEEEKVLKAAASYLELLGTELTESFGLSEETAAGFFRDHRLSEKLVDTVTAGMNLEVSESEARVISVSMIELSDGARAEEISALVHEEGADFYAIAKENSENPEINHKLFRGIYGKDFDDAAFALENEGISDVIYDDGRYYILKCLSDYEEADTKVRKSEMLSERKNQAFYHVYEEFLNEHELEGDPALWDGLLVSQAPVTAADFFEIYETEFPPATE